MAYVSKELKEHLAPKLRSLAKSYVLTATVAVHHHSTLVLNVSKGRIDFIKDNADTLYEKNHWAPDNEQDHERNLNRKYMQVSHHWTDLFTGDAKEFLDKAFAIMHEGNHDNSDIMTDYWDVGWYTDINIGKWDKPYTLTV
jgi:hypothetical protein